MNRKQLKQDLVDAAEHLNRLGFVVAGGGLLSAHIDQEVYFTPPGVHRARLDPRELELVRLDGKGKQVIPTDTESWTHLMIYHERPDIVAVINAQPPTATGFAVSGESVEPRILPEALVQLGSVPLIRRDSDGRDGEGVEGAGREARAAVGPDDEVQDGTVRAGQLGDGRQHDDRSPAAQASRSVLKRLSESKAFVISNQGVLTVGADVWDAVARLELVEHCAKVQVTARALGRVEALSDAQVARLVEVHFEAQGGRHS